MNGAQIPQGNIPTFDPTRQRPVMPANMELVVNALDMVIEFEICGFPGSPAMKFTLAPGAQAMLPATYCQPIPGANPKIPRPSVLAMVTSVEPYPGGNQIQGVVPLDQAEATRRKWAEAKYNAPKHNVVVLQDKEGNQVNLAIPKDRPLQSRRAAAPDDDEEDEDDVIEPPPPGVDDIRAAPPVAAPAAKPKAPAKPKTPTKGNGAPAAPKTITDGGE